MNSSLCRSSSLFPLIFLFMFLLRFFEPHNRSSDTFVRFAFGVVVFLLFWWNYIVLVVSDL